MRSTSSQLGARGTIGISRPVISPQAHHELAVK
jgi:hypothetical protein